MHVFGDSQMSSESQLFIFFIIYHYYDRNRFDQCNTNIGFFITSIFIINFGIRLFFLSDYSDGKTYGIVVLQMKQKIICYYMDIIYNKQTLSPSGRSSRSVQYLVFLNIRIHLSSKITVVIFKIIFILLKSES